MRQFLSSFLLVTVLLGASPADAQRNIRLIAPPGTNASSLGLVYNANLEPVRSLLFPSLEGGEVVAESRTFRDVRQIAGQSEIRGNVGVWGIGMSADESHSTSVGYIRAISLERVVQVPRALPVPSSDERPPGAAFFVSKIYFGRMYELRVTGSRTHVEARISHLAFGAGESVSSVGVQTQGYTLGLTPRDDGLLAMSASTPNEINERFEASGPAVPIFVELEALSPAETTPLPSAASQIEADTSIRPPQYSIEILSLSFPSRKPNGRGWDAFGGAPDMQVTFIQNGRALRHVTAPRDTLLANFRSTMLGVQLSVGPDTPLIVRFTDQDISRNDFAGEVTVTSLHDGDNNVVASTGARVVLRVISR